MELGLLAILILGSLIHVCLAALAAHRWIHNLAVCSGTLHLLWVAFLAGLLEVLVVFVFLVFSALAIDPIDLGWNLSVILYVGAFFLPPTFVPSLVVYHFFAKAHEQMK
jgi:hypothetical protein